MADEDVAKIGAALATKIEGAPLWCGRSCRTTAEGKVTIKEFVVLRAESFLKVSLGEEDVLTRPVGNGVDVAKDEGSRVAFDVVEDDRKVADDADIALGAVCSLRADLRSRRPAVRKEARIGDDGVPTHAVPSYGASVGDRGLRLGKRVDAQSSCRVQTVGDV